MITYDNVPLPCTVPVVKELLLYVCPSNLVDADVTVEPWLPLVAIENFNLDWL